MNFDPAGEPASNRWRDDAIIVAVLAAMAAVFAFGGWAWRLDRLVYDNALTLWSRPSPPGVLIIAIDDASVQSIGRWPWRRAVHATLLERLAAAHPRAIALDLLLSEPDADPDQDRLLANALTHAKPVVLPIAWQSVGQAGYIAIEPIAAFRGAVTLGASESTTDADGVLRHAFVDAGPTGDPFPHLAEALLTAGGEAVNPRIGFDADPTRTIGNDTGWRRDRRFAIRYAGPPGSVEQVSYVDVLRGKVPASRIAGRYVLVGTTAQGLGDHHVAPVDGRGPAMAGVEVLANILYTLRSGDRIVELGGFIVTLISACLLALLVPMFQFVGPRRALPIAIAAIVLAIGGSVLALRGGVWFNPMPFTLASLLAYPLWSWRRLERAMAGIDHEIGHLTGAPPTADLRGDAIGARLQALRKAGDVVRDARRFLAEAIGTLPTAMLVAADDQRVLLANTRAAQVFDVESADELIGLDLARLLQEFTTPDSIDWKTALSARIVDIATEARLGDALAVMTHVAAVDFQDARRFIVTMADVGPIRQAEREREEALAFVSHDLRSPATSIVMLADMNLHDTLDAPRSPHDAVLQQMRQLAQRTLELADAFVRSSRAESQALLRTATSLGELMADALIDLRPQAAMRHVTIDLHHADAHANVDRFLVVRAIANLVSNAIKYSPPGGVIEIDSVIDDGLLRVRVRDHGPGLAPSQLADLAEGDHGTSVGAAGGVGLGLVFVQRVAKRHGGSLRVLSASATSAGSGAVFELELPA